MKAARVHAKGKEYSIDEVSVPEVERETDLVIQIKAASLCHTDFMVRDGVFGDNYPITGSHEAVGIVHEVGSAVQNFSKGDRVGTLAFQNACGSCPDCKAGLDIYCENLSGMGGVTTDGGFAGYMKCDSRFCVKIPESLPFPQAAPLMCAGATIYGALKKCRLSKGDLVGIVGVGGLGHIGIQLAKCMGLNVVAIDSRKEPIDLAKTLKYPPDLTINVKDTEAKDAMKRISEMRKNTDWPGLDACIVATDSSPAFLYSADITRKHGLMVVVGQPADPVQVTYHSLIFRNIKVIGSLLSNVDEAQEMLKIIAEKDIKITVKEYPMAKVNDMVEDTHKENMKGRLVMTM
ncbi:Alcohol dehydrogenase [Taphrina deformans PYCC 5710]|uniref:Alcohol dehydrogenase n=1 Tax=Taphrina deformans (strain PYCC 5710 / ATCC 11124 / CBS 356.35 / IMI 108563 / JCM 9778 / NBRC 8474) TaxID=1097556 RepID=R4X8N1_TAPDE|nr:Alcohol dehydrogenase [Taphrina deformans PYCC 5710]|eukprot:CCG81730.1 Alcohol dehydrogenase [Taphrina deformans PYCC 5710]